ncbi:MAG: acetate kinase, partial [Pirellulaceae bacterium]
ECCISADNSRIQVWVVPTNEELIVARQARELLEG